MIAMTRVARFMFTVLVIYDPGISKAPDILNGNFSFCKIGFLTASKCLSVPPESIFKIDSRGKPEKILEIYECRLYKEEILFS